MRAVAQQSLRKQQSHAKVAKNDNVYGMHI